MRLDLYLSENNMVKSRESAKNLIVSGGVCVNGKAATKPSKEVSDTDDVQITAELPKYVGRGGLKLEKALQSFKIDVNGLVCMDIGASTGGFTDCMLQNNAKLVYALDVGHGQLDEKLINDERVINLEGTNFRDIICDDYKIKPTFITADVSFISLTKIIPKISQMLDFDGHAVMLIKPQFECGRADIGKNGIVRSKKVHIRVLKDILSFCENNALGVIGLDFSPIQGGDGNIEYLVYVKKNGQGKIIDCENIVNQAHKNL